MPHAGSPSVIRSCTFTLYPPGRTPRSGLSDSPNPATQKKSVFVLDFYDNMSYIYDKLS